MGVLTNQKRTIDAWKEQVAIWSKLKEHHNIIHLNAGVVEFDRAADGDNLFVCGFEMPFSDIGDLEHFMKTDQWKNFGRNQKRDIFYGICRGLQHSHEMGICHGDLKPHNILLFGSDEELVPKLSDFGFALVIGTLGKKGGTPEYMAPEQFTGGQPTVLSDIYSLGILFFQITTGRLPFHAEWTTNDERFRKYQELHQQSPRPKAFADNPAIGEPLSELIYEMMSIEPDDRPRSAKDIGLKLVRIRDESLIQKIIQVHPKESPTRKAIFEENTYRWNPKIHVAFGEQLHFIWTHSPFSIHQIRQTIETSFSKAEIKGCSIYPIFGCPDTLLRLCGTVEQRRRIDELLNYFKSAGFKFEELTVNEIHYLFCKQVIPKENDRHEIAKALRKSCGSNQFADLRKLYYISGRLNEKRRIKVFTAVKTIFGDATSPRTLTAILRNKFPLEKHFEKIRPSIYSGTGDFAMLVKFTSETNKYFEIKDVPYFIQETASAHGINVRTETFLLADRNYVESDDGQLDTLVRQAFAENSGSIIDGIKQE